MAGMHNALEPYAYHLETNRLLPSPFKVVGEVTVWQGHSAEQVKAMKEGLAKLEEQGIRSLNEE